jgi:outer membrane usher protein
MLKRGRGALFCSVACAACLIGGGVAGAETGSDTVAGTASAVVVTQARVPAGVLNPSGRSMQVVAPLNDRGVYLGDVEIQVGADDSISVAAMQVVETLARLMDPVALESLRSVATPGVFLPISRFAELGVPLTFDPALLSLEAEIPTSMRARRSIGLADLDRSVYGEFLSPEPFSAYVNFRAAADYVHEGSSTGFGDTFILMNGAMRFGGFVLESEGNWTSGDRGFSRDGTRLVYDDIERLNRWTAGDLLPQGRGFQGFSNMAGLSMERAYGLLDPQRNTTPRGGRTFTVDREATVEAYVNGRVVRTMRLQPGTYDVSDFPFVQGSNDIQLVISDGTGYRDVVSFSLFVDRTQLAAGLSEYGLYAGVASERTPGEISYTEDLAVSGFYRRGVRDNLTAGGNFQYFDDGSLVGAEIVWGSPIGTIGGDFAFSDNPNVGDGWAANLSFERLVQDAGGFGGSSFIAAFEARSRHFGSPTQLAPENRYEYNASMSYNRSFGDSSFVGGQVRYAKARDGFEDEMGARVSYGRRVNDLTNVVLDLDWTEGGFAEGTSARISLVRRFGSSGSMRASYDTRSERARVGYQQSSGGGVGAWSVAGAIEAGRDDLGFNGAGAYAANRADLGIAHNTTYTLDTDEVSDQRTSLRAATSIAFAGGRFAVGRPITDSFAIVAAHDRSVDIEVEPTRDGYFARSGALGPALYGQMGSYTPRSIIFDAPDAPPGYDVGQGAARVLPPYRAGYSITVGSDYGVTALGRLLDERGEPVVLLAGMAVEIGGEGRRVEVFTNRMGAFGASGLKAGRWRIEMPGQPPLVYELDIPDSPNGIARMGDVRPSR